MEMSGWTKGTKTVWSEYQARFQRVDTDAHNSRSSSTCSSMGTHSETDEEATSFYRLYGDSMSESSSVISDPPLETEDSDDEDFATNAPPAFIRDELSYNPENEDVRSDFPSLSCLNTSPASAIPRPPKMTSRLSTDTIKIRLVLVRLA